MNLDKYQKQARKTAMYPQKIIYPVLGLNGEAGEVAEKVKKIIRDDNCNFNSKKNKKEIALELGDVLWYLANIASDLDLSLTDVAKMNINKLKSRKDRSVLGGSGDNR